MVNIFPSSNRLSGGVSTITSIRFQNVAFGYGADAMIFKSLNFEVPMNKNILVTGPAANGQSTFLKLLAVMLQPTSGKYLINDIDTTQMTFEEFLPFRLKMGYTFDYGGLFSNRTLHDNLVLPMLYHKICKVEEASSRTEHLAAHFNFAKQLDRRPAEVSGGLRKLVCVLRAFALNPEMIVMDDPFTGIDTENSKRLIQMIQDQRECGRLKHLFFTSRDELWANRLGYQPIIIEDGNPRFEENRSEGVA